VLPFDQIEESLRSRSIFLIDGGKSLTQVNSQCQPRSAPNKSNRSGINLAIIISYRNRNSNLRVFLINMHRFLSDQKVNYGIYVIEPVANATWNKGILLNIGFVESQKDVDRPLDYSALSGHAKQGINERREFPKSLEWTCFFFHDADMLALFRLIFLKDGYRSF
jgi:hypothetical protein